MSSDNTMSKLGPAFCGTPLQLFKSFLFVLPDGTLDASKIHSRECYLHFLTIRHKVDTDNEVQKFRRTLSNQLSGVDGRTPFLPEEESAILKVLRVKRKWPCVPDHSPIGVTGFRSKGYHEKRADAGLSSKKQKIASEESDIAEKIDNLTVTKMDTIVVPRTGTPQTFVSSDTDYKTDFSSTVRFSFDLPGIIGAPGSEMDPLNDWLSENTL
jgi:hypothetical protein